jgi:hypothetical protein
LYALTGNATHTRRSALAIADEEPEQAVLSLQTVQDRRAAEIQRATIHSPTIAT